MINSPIFRQHNFDTDFFRQWTCLEGLTMDFVVDEPQHIVLTGHMDVHHRGLVNGPVGYAGMLSIVRAETLSGLSSAPLSWNTPIGELLPGSINGGNVRDVQQHYGKIAWNGHRLLQPGAYRILAHANSHSDLAPSTDGLIETLVEGGKGLNCLIACFHAA